MSPTTYHVLHVASVLLLVAYTFRACAAPRPELRRGALIVTGILSLVAVVAGFGLLGKLGLGFEPWIIVKLVCWLLISGLTGMAFRRPSLAGMLSLLTAALAVVAVYCVYFRPFA